MPHSYVLVILKQKLKRMLPLEFPEAPHSLELFFLQILLAFFLALFGTCGIWRLIVVAVLHDDINCGSCCRLWTPCRRFNPNSSYFQ